MRTSAVCRALCAVLALSACGSKEETVAEATASPFLALDTPALADWLPAGEVVASGRATGLRHVSVNGVVADRTGDGYAAPIVLERGINVVEARGDLETGHVTFLRNAVIAGEFADPGAVIDRAMAVRVNEGGLEVVMAEVGAMIDAETINADLAAANPVYEDAYGVFGWNAVEVAADLGSLVFADPRLEADPATGVLTVEVALPDLEVYVPVHGTILGWDFGVDIWLGADSAEVTGLLTLDAEDGRLQADLGDATVSLVGFWYDTSLLPGEIEQLILVDTVRTAIEDTIVTELEAQVPALIEAQLAALELTFETEILDQTVTVEALVDSASIDPDGIAIVADLDVELPGSGDHPYAGYLAAGSADVRPDTSPDVAMSLSDDLLNRVLFEAWRSGLLAMTLSTDDGSLDAALLTQLGARDEATVRVDAVLPPVIVEEAGGLEAQVGELMVTIETPGGTYGERLVLSLAVFVGLDLVVEGGELVVDLLEPELVLTVRDNDWGVSNVAITNLLADQLPIEALLLLVGDLRFPLPTLGEVAIGEATVERDETGVYTGVAIELD